MAWCYICSPTIFPTALTLADLTHSYCNACVAWQLLDVTWEKKAAPVTTAMQKSLYYLQPVPSAFTSCSCTCLQSSHSKFIFWPAPCWQPLWGKALFAGSQQQCVGWGSKLLPCHLQMAKAGFVHCPNANRPDVAKCFFCLIELESWEPNDDPW